MEKPNLEIYISAHKEAEFPKDEAYIPIHVGRVNSTITPICAVGDDTGDNISHLNPFFCEITALYWMWKNSQAKFIGLVHYRRHFAGGDNPILLDGQNIASGRDLSERLEQFDIIVPPIMVFYHENTKIPCSLEQQYMQVHVGHDLVLIREAIDKLCDDYLPAFDFVMRNNQCATYNMFVGRKKIMDKYCKWLFEILFLLEKWIPYRSYNSYQARVFGFLAERLFNVWLARNRKDFSICYWNVVLL